MKTILGFWSQRLTEQSCLEPERQCLEVFYGITTCSNYINGYRFTNILATVASGGKFSRQTHQACS